MPSDSFSQLNILNMSKTSPKKTELILALSEVFRSYGYEAASLSKLVEASGLERASLYHYFPKGKKDIACEVFLLAIQSLEEKVLKALKSDEEPKTRLIKMTRALSDFYSGGLSICFITIFSLGEIHSEVKSSMNQALNTWAELLSKTYKELGVKNAKKRALISISAIQGSLVISKNMDNSVAFESVLDSIKKI